ncbi:MAG: hypothetical protein LIO67_05800 [Lachnospiraceae bacterium]|nr:hypothetical protein [Lachnospiraceae bacterium]
MDNWYSVSTYDNSADDFLHMFGGFHDFRIIEVNYCGSKDSVDVLLEYDDRSLRILLRFEGYVQFYIAPVDEYEAEWIWGVSLHRYKNQIRWINDEWRGIETEPIGSEKKITFFQGNTLIWAIVDKNGNPLPVTDDLLHPCWRTYNCETNQYDEEYHDFSVIPV